MISAAEAEATSPVRRRTVTGEIVETLNHALAALRRDADPDEVRRIVEGASGALSTWLLDWLRDEGNSRDVEITGHFEGSKASATFTRFRCRRQGTESSWEKAGEWKGKVADEGDLSIAHLLDLAPSHPGLGERLRSSLPEPLLRFIGRL